MEERKRRIMAAFTDDEYQQIARKAYESRCSKGAIVAKMVVAGLDSEEEERQG